MSPTWFENVPPDLSCQIIYLRSKNWSPSSVVTKNMVKILPPDPFFPKKKRKKMLIIHTSVGLHAYPPGWPHTNSINNELKQKAGRVTYAGGPGCQKSWWVQDYVVDKIAPSYWNRVNFSVKNWRGQSPLPTYPYHPAALHATRRSGQTCHRFQFDRKSIFFLC